jgi:hypothetical protein
MSENASENSDVEVVLSFRSVYSPKANTAMCVRCVKSHFARGKVLKR